MLISFFTCTFLYPFFPQKKLARIYENIMQNLLLNAMTLPGFWNLKVIDNRKVKDWNNRYVIICNHLSFADSLINCKIPLEKKYMIGRVFMKIPIFGWLAQMLGFVGADRNVPVFNTDAVHRAISTIEKDKSSFLIYPEGRRELVPYKLETFKTGAFRIARNCELQILPITLVGTYPAMKGYNVNKSNIFLYIDEPFTVEDTDYKKWAEYSQTVIQKNLDKHVLA